jgi:hypothetical protein
MMATTLPTDTVSSVTVEHVATFRREGFLRVGRVVQSGELRDLQRIAIAEENGDTGGLVGDSDDAPALAATYGYHRDPKYRQMWTNAFDLRLRHPELVPIVRRCATIARQLIGTDDIRVFWDKTFSKPPLQQGTRESVWHQDWPYLPIDRRGFLAFWIAVEDVTEASGAMRFVPRSHRLGPLGRLDLVGADHQLSDILRPDDLAEVGDPITVPLAAGEATIHDGLTLHGAGPNLTDRPRRGWTIVFLPGDTLWTGGPHPHAELNRYLDQVNGPFDHPRFQVPD